VRRRLGRMDRWKNVVDEEIKTGEDYQS